MDFSDDELLMPPFKRRKILASSSPVRQAASTPENEEDIVATSDNEELEVLYAEQDSYWRSVVTSPTRSNARSSSPNQATLITSPLANSSHYTSDLPISSRLTQNDTSSPNENLAESIWPSPTSSQKNRRNTLSSSLTKESPRLSLDGPLLSPPPDVVEQNLVQPTSNASSSLSLPPSIDDRPQRRVTRDSNKNFRPYTLYKLQYGDAELRRLEEKEMAREERKNNQTMVYEHDGIWNPSQSLDVDDQETQTQYLNVRKFESTKKRKRKEGASDNSEPTIPLWKQRAPRLEKQTLEPPPPKGFRRFVEPNGSPPLKDRQLSIPSDSDSHPKKDADDSPRALKAITSSDGSEEEGIVDQEAKSTGKEMEDSDKTESDTESSESETEMIARRQTRILSKIVPAVMVKKLLRDEERKEKEKERILHRRDSHKSDAIELSDSNDNNVQPGQSKRVHGVREHQPIIGDSESEDEHRSIGGVIEIDDSASDRESLDHDDDRQNQPIELSDDDSYVRRAGSVEAIEDNRVGGSRRHSEFKKKFDFQELPSHYFRRGNGMPFLRQTRIDILLNSTNGRRSAKSNQKKMKASIQGVSSHDQSRDPSSNRKPTIPHNIHIISDASKGYHQTRLPFKALSGDFDTTDRDPSHIGNRPTSKKTKKSASGKGGKGVSSTLHVQRGSGQSSLWEQTGHADLLQSLTPLATHNIDQAMSRPHSSKLSRSSKPSSKSGPKPNSSMLYEQTDVDSRIEISLNSSLAFGMRRQRDGFSLPESSWISKGRLLELVRVLCGNAQDAPFLPFPCSVSSLRLSASTTASDLLIHIPTICDLLFDSISKKVPVGSDEYNDSQSLMRFLCLFITYATHTAEGCHDETKEMLTFLREQINTLMERVDEWTNLIQMTGKDFNHILFSTFWFAVEASNRIAHAFACLESAGTNFTLGDTTSDLHTENLMTVLHEFGIRRTTKAFQSSQQDLSIEIYALELWIALIHVVLLQPSTAEERKQASDCFWRHVENSLQDSSRAFPSGVHEAEYIWATIFSLCSISCVDLLGRGQGTRRLEAYWRIACKALNSVNLSPEHDKSRKLSQAILAQRDVYIGMLFARCQVLVFRWSWSLQDKDADQLFNILRDALKARGFRNLLHEQSDFPYFVTRRDFSSLATFEPKDSIQTILIKLMLERSRSSSTNSNLRASFKWISGLASTSAIQFTKASPPTRKELSAVFNRFTINFVLLYIKHDPNDAKAFLRNSKSLVNFATADLGSKQACIRAAMVFGRMYRHFCLPLEEITQWIEEIGEHIMTDYSSAGDNLSSRELKELALLCGLVVGSLKDILISRRLTENDEEDDELLFPEPCLCISGFLTKLLRAPKLFNICSEDVVSFLLSIFETRETFISPPPIPPFPQGVIEEESQEDYGFEAIDINDPQLTAALMGPNWEASNKYKDMDIALAKNLATIVSPMLSSLGKLALLDAKDRDLARIDSWLDCWSQLGAITSAHNLKSWDYFLQLGPAALDRVGDIGWQRLALPRFLLGVLRADPSAYLGRQAYFLRVWFTTMATMAPTLLEPAYTYTLFRIDGFKHPLFIDIPFRKHLPEEDFGVEVFLDIRIEILSAVFRNLERLYRQAEGTRQSDDIARKVEGCEGVVELLRTMLTNLEDHSERLQIYRVEYIPFCQEIVQTIRSLAIQSDERIAQLLSSRFLGLIGITI